MPKSNISFADTESLALSIAHLFATQRKGQSSIEPLAYVAGAVVAILTAVLASLAPARRAASVQPMVAMRSA